VCTQTVDRASSFVAVAVQVWFAHDEISIRPGDSTSMSLAIENVGDTTETYTIIPAGFTAAWLTVTRSNVTLFGGSRDVIEVIVRPPAIHSTTAGPTAINVRVIPQTNPDDTAVAETITNVTAFDDRRITTLQPIQRARRRTTYEFVVENHGNNLANCRLHLVDASARVDGSFDPPAVGVAPGSSSLVRLNAKAQGGMLRRRQRQLDFEIEATEPDHDPAIGRVTLIQTPTISGHSVARALGFAAAALALIAAWFGVIRPELRDAADRAVEERIGDLAVAPESVESPVSTLPPTADADPAGTDVNPIVAVAQDEGEPVSYRLSLDVGIGQERSELVTIPPDSRFHLTDIVLQNPNGDLGTAQLLRNGDILYEFDLGAMTSANEFQPRITPLPFDPSDNLVLAVSCDATGSPAGTDCEIAALVGGVLLPADF
jgi:hypothetical protein